MDIICGQLTHIRHKNSMFSIIISSVMEEYLIPYHSQFVILVTITGSNICLIVEVKNFTPLQGK